MPIGAAAHSFGLETLTAEEAVTVPDLAAFLAGYLEEAGALEAAFCRAAHGLLSEKGVDFIDHWHMLNAELGALKPARESRTASVTLGRRFLQLAASLSDHPALKQALPSPSPLPGGWPRNEAGRGSSGGPAETHHCTAFGLTGAALGVSEETTALAYLQQNVTGLVSACQRLMPLGQQRASQLLWDLKPALVRAAQCADAGNVTCFTPMLDVAAMRHPTLSTRLFIS